ncbi:MAG: class II aldolase/adducin family protein [Syntrophomonadaceae bacterium]|nr:class II aldolase/adducin family protein [Syntrophomonadaceae bacterium]
MSKYQSYKETVLQYSQRLSQNRYTVGTGGNISLLIEGENAIAITPTAMDYFGIHVDDICIVDFDMNILEGKLKPSIETKMHIEVYKNRLDVNAIIHTHQVYASIFALINEPIPALFDEVTLNTGHIIDVIPYALSGSQQLSQNIVNQLNNRCNCYFIQNHGALSLGMSIENAYRNVELLEKISRTYYYALASGRPITKLPDAVVARLCKNLHERQDQEIARKKAGQAYRLN